MRYDKVFRSIAQNDIKGAVRELEKLDDADLGELHLLTGAADRLVSHVLDKRRAKS